MTTINNLIRQAKAQFPPSELTINESEVGTVVEHIMATSAGDKAARTLIERQLRLGRVKLYEIPIRVVGQPSKET